MRPVTFEKHSPTLFYWPTIRFVDMLFWYSLSATKGKVGCNYIRIAVDYRRYLVRLFLNLVISDFGLGFEENTAIMNRD